MSGAIAKETLAEQLLPPSSRLPPIRKIGAHSVSELSSSVKYLRRIYNPEVRGSRGRRQKHVFGINTPMKGIVKTSDKATSLQSAELDALRTDTFERAYAIRWLTSLIAHLGEAEGEDEDSEALLQDVASVLAICSGTAGAGIITRNFSFSSPFSHSSGSAPISIQLMDAPLENHNYGSVGAQTWGGACVMAELIAEDPRSFGLATPPDNATARKLKVLELGAGTGLVSLTVGKLMQLQNEILRSSAVSVPEVEVVATDYYPSVLSNLELNISSNFFSKEREETSQSSMISVSTHALDWSRFPNAEAASPPLDEPFDVILGADIIYETEHASWIKSCLEKLLLKSFYDTLTPEPLFHLIIPLRATHTLESNSIEAVFPFDTNHESDAPELVIKSKDIFVCDAGESGKDGEEVEYAYYQIGWGAT